jgi:hypothetical protein
MYRENTKNKNEKSTKPKKKLFSFYRSCEKLKR